MLISNTGAFDVFYKMHYWFTATVA